MNCSIDIGNTLIKIGSFEGKRPTGVETIQTYVEMLKFLESKTPDNIIISSVKSDTSEWTNQLPLSIRSIILNNTTPLPVRNLYKTPATLGSDRLSACIGAFSLYPNTNCLVVDAGTCIKCDIIDQNGNFYGGSISPGIQMRLYSLNQSTSRLPLVSSRKINFVTGQSTEESILSGVLNGILFEIEGFIERYSEIFPQLNVILTGGDADSFDGKVKHHIFVVPNLVLLGLNEILQYNLSYTSA